MRSRRQLEDLAAVVGGLAVCGCLPGSTASEAGVRYGDILLRVNGVPTPTVDDYLAARKLRTDGYELRLFRDGDEFELFVAFRPPADTLLALAHQLAEGRYIASDSSAPPPKSQPS